MSRSSWLPARLRGVVCSGRSNISPRRFRLDLETLEDRLTLDSGGAAGALTGGTLIYNNGPLIGNVRVQPIFLQNTATQSVVPTATQTKIQNFFQTITTDSFIPSLMSQYSAGGTTIGTGSVAAADTNVASNSVPYTDPFNVSYPNSIDDSTLQTIISQEIAANKVVAPTSNTLYFVYTAPGDVVTTLPSGDSVNVFGGYHSAFPDANNKLIYYAIIPYPGSPNGLTPDATVFQSMTFVSSHELAEAITDPDAASGWFSASQSGGGEIGDEGNGSSYMLDNYYVEDMWSNGVNSAATSTSSNGKSFFVNQISAPALTGLGSIPVATFTNTDTSLTAASFTARVFTVDNNTGQSADWPSTITGGTNGLYVVNATPLSNLNAGSYGDFDTKNNFQFDYSGLNVSVYNGPPANSSGVGLESPIATRQVPYTLTANSAAMTYNADPYESHNFTLLESGLNYQLTDNGVLVFTQPIARTSSIVIGADPGTNSSLTIDNSGGIIGASVSFDGGSGSGKHSLSIINGTLSILNAAFTNSSSGNITKDLNVSFTDVNNTLSLLPSTVGTLNLTVPIGNITATLSDDPTTANNISEFSSSNAGFPAVFYTSPTSAMGVNYSSGMDLTVSAFDSKFGASLTLSDSNVGGNSVTFASSLSLPGINATAGFIAINAPLSSTAGTDLVFTDGTSLNVAVNATLTSSGAIQIGGGVATLNANLTATSMIVFTAAVSLGTDETLTAPSVSFNSLNDAALGAHSLTILGDANFATIGTSTPIGSLAVSGTTTTLGDSSISTQGTQNYHDIIFSPNSKISMAGSTINFLGVINLGSSTLSATGNLNLTPSSSLDETIVSTTSFGAIIGDTITLAGSLVLSNTASSLPLSTAFDIITCGTRNGTFAGETQNAVINAGGINFKISYIGGTGKDVILTSVPAGGVGNKLAFVQLPAIIQAGQLSNPVIAVAVEDVNGNISAGDTSSVTISLFTNPVAGDTLTGTFTVTAVGGIATFGDLTIQGLIGKGFIFQAVDTTLPSATNSVKSSAVEVVAGPTTHIAWQTQPSAVQVGQPISPAPQIVLLDKFGNTVLSDTNPVAIAFDKNPTSASLTGTLTVIPKNGVATFSNIAVSANGTGYTLIANQGTVGASGTLYSPESDLFNTLAVSASLSSGVLTVSGDTTDNIIKLELDGSVPTNLDVFNGSTFFKSFTFASVNSVVVNLLAGNDSLIIDNTHGEPIPKGGFTYDGGTGNNTLVAPNLPNAWTITGANAGSLTTTSGTTFPGTFKNAGNIIGGASSDAYTFETAGSLSSTLNGGLGNNSLDYSTYAGRTVFSLSDLAATGVRNLSKKSVFNIQTVTANSDPKYKNLFVGLNTFATSFWSLSGTNAGSMSNTGNSTIYTFTNFGSVTGGSGADIFRMIGNVSLTGTIDGAGDTPANFIDYSQYTDAASNPGKVIVSLASNAASGIRNLSGSSVFNILNFIGSPSASPNILVGADLANTWNITSTNAGYLTDALVPGGLVSFSNFANLTGGNAADNFQFGPGANIDGKLDGRKGLNTLDYSQQTTAISVDLSHFAAADINNGHGGSAYNIQNFIGSTGVNNFVGGAGSNNWNLTSTTGGVINSTYTFSNFTNLIGSTSNDLFIIPSGITFGGTIDGGLGSNTVDYSTWTTNLTINLALGNATGFGGIRRIQNVFSGSGSDFITGSVDGGFIVGGAGIDQIVGGAGRSILIGGAGNDTIQGGSGDDIIIAGTTSYDHNITALQKLLVEWQRTDISFTARVTNINTGTGTTTGYKFVLGSTVLNDSASNNLTGDLGTPNRTDSNWFLDNTSRDTISDKQSGDQIN